MSLVFDFLFFICKMCVYAGVLVCAGGFLYSVYGVTGSTGLAVVGGVGLLVLLCTGAPYTPAGANLAWAESEWTRARVLADLARFLRR